MCEINTPCGGVLFEDITITKELQSVGVYDRIIYSCMNAHHLVVPARTERPPERIVVRGEREVRRMAPRLAKMRCENCSCEFEYRVKPGYERKFCSKRCSCLYQGELLRVERSLQAV